MATLREILAKFSVSFDDTELKKGDKGVQALFDKLKKVGGLLAGGVIGAKLRDMTMELANQGDALAKQSDALGVSMKDLQGWHYAAEGAGVAAEEFNGALTKFGQAIVNASGGTGPAAEAFRKLGVSVKDSAGNLGEPIELIDGVVAGLENIEHPAKRAEAVMALFGKSGTKLLPLFSQGAEGIAKIRAEVEQLGGGFSPEFAKSAAAMNDEIARLNMAWLSFKVRVGGLVIPLISRFVTVVTKTTAWVTKLGKSSYLLESAFVVVGAAAVVMGRKMALAGLRALVPWLPMIAAMAALVLVSDELITLWNGGDTLIGRAIDNIFGEGSAQKAVEWVKGVIKNVEELFDGNDRALADFFGGLELMWFDFTTWLEGGWQQLWTAMKLLCYDTFTTLEGWVASLGDSFAEMWNSVVDGATSALGVLGKVLDVIPGAGDLAKKVSDAQKDWQYAKMGTGGRAEHDETVARQRLKLVQSGDQDPAAIAAQRAAIMDRADAVARGTSIVAPTENNITVNVGAGASPQQIRQIKEVVIQGTRQGSSGARKALTQRAPSTG